MVAPVEATVAAARASLGGPGVRCFCPIWKDPWMAVGVGTYAHDLLTLCGGENVFADREERRYPIVTEAEIVAAAPEVVLLPDEPYAVGPDDAAARPADDPATPRRSRPRSCRPRAPRARRPGSRRPP